MTEPLPLIPLVEPAVARLAALAPLDAAAKSALAAAVRKWRNVPARRELLIEGREIAEPLLMVKGWAARIRELADGRRQILSFLLPGDVIGLCDHERPLANSTVATITEVGVCTAPKRGISPALDEAYSLSHAFEEAYLIAQITRLGQLNAYERLADLLLELLERLEIAGLASGGTFTLPMTQEMLADALGLTPVHMNRTIQAMRRDNSIILKNRSLTIVDPDLLNRQMGRIPIHVSAMRIVPSPIAASSGHGPDER